MVTFTSSWSMVNRAQSSTQTLGNLSSTIELKHGRGRNMESQLYEFFPGEVLHQSVNEKNKLATEPIF